MKKIAILLVSAIALCSVQAISEPLKKDVRIELSDQITSLNLNVVQSVYEFEAREISQPSVIELAPIDTVKEVNLEIEHRFTGYEPVRYSIYLGQRLLTKHDAGKPQKGFREVNQPLTAYSYNC